MTGFYYFDPVPHDIGQSIMPMVIDCYFIYSDEGTRILDMLEIAWKQTEGRVSIPLEELVFIKWLSDQYWKVCIKEIGK